MGYDLFFNKEKLKNDLIVGFLKLIPPFLGNFLRLGQKSPHFLEIINNLTIRPIIFP